MSSGEKSSDTSPVTSVSDDMSPLRLSSTSASTVCSSSASSSPPETPLSSSSCGHGDAILNSLHFHNRNLAVLRVDPSQLNSPRIVRDSVFSFVTPTPVQSPRLMVKSSKALQLLGIPEDVPAAELETYFSGNQLMKGSTPAAHVYCGHQFGSFAGQLGDGAAISLGEIVHADTQERWELQLKGAGPTPFSRTADGRKVLRSSVREFLCSEAMHHLHIPTTRAGTCITSDTYVTRDPLYSGNVIQERCTVISRLAPNFFRFGSFEIFLKPTAETNFRGGPSHGNETLRVQLLDHILTYYPHINALDVSADDKYARLFQEIVSRTIDLVVKWQSTGFTHGVLNTDNMSIMGLTIDYGPYGFMEYFDQSYTPNGSDHSGRYCFQDQPKICKYNLYRLLDVLVPYVRPDDAAKCLQQYDETYRQRYLSTMAAKLGLWMDSGCGSGAVTGAVTDTETEPKKATTATTTATTTDELSAFVDELLSTMHKTKADYTDTFVAFTDFVRDLQPLTQSTAPTTTDSQTLRTSAAYARLRQQLLKKLLYRTANLKALKALALRKMKLHSIHMNPAQVDYLYHLFEENNVVKLHQIFSADAPLDIIRNEIYQEKHCLNIISEAQTILKGTDSFPSDQSKVADNQGPWEALLQKYDDLLWRQLVSHQTASQPEKSLAETLSQRHAAMRAANPTFILRNWMLQDAIVAAEDHGDFEPVQELLRMAERPFDDRFNVFQYCDVDAEVSLSPTPSDAEASGPGICGLGASQAAVVERTAARHQLSEIERRYLTSRPDSAMGIICTCSS